MCTTFGKRKPMWPCRLLAAIGRVDYGGVDLGADGLHNAVWLTLTGDGPADRDLKRPARKPQPLGLIIAAQVALFGGLAVVAGWEVVVFALATAAGLGFSAFMAWYLGWRAPR